MKIKILMIILMMAVFGLSGFAETHTASSLSYEDIKKTLDLCNPGDVLALPSGDVSSSWYSILSVPNGISIIGAGKDKTIIRNTATSRYMMYFNYDDAERDGIEISGFSLYGTGYGGGGGSGIKLYHCEKMPDIVLHDLRFQNFSGTGLNFSANAVSGLVYNCIFKNIVPLSLSSTGYGINIVGDNNWDIPPPVLGTAEMVFIEDNLFDNCKHSIVGIKGSHIVARYNIMINPVSNRFIADIHGYQDQNPVSQDDGDPDNLPGSTWEWYLNSMTGRLGDINDEGLGLRGGRGAVWGNLFFGFEESGFPISTTAHKAIRVAIDDFPAVYHPGSVAPFYVWENKLNGSDLIDISVARSASAYVEKDKDYFMSMPDGYSPFVYPHPARGLEVPPEISNICINIIDGKLYELGLTFTFMVDGEPQKFDGTFVFSVSKENK